MTYGTRGSNQESSLLIGTKDAYCLNLEQSCKSKLKKKAHRQNCKQIKQFKDKCTKNALCIARCLSSVYDYT